MRVKLLLTSCLAGFLCGCQTEGRSSTPADAPTLSAAAAGAIAGDLSGRFAEQAGSAPKFVKLRDDGTPFATALEAALNGWGYTIAKDESPLSDKSSPLASELGYSLTDLDGRVLARLSTNTMTLSRIYSVNAGGAVPASPLSVMKRN